MIKDSNKGLSKSCYFEPQRCTHLCYICKYRHVKGAHVKEKRKISVVRQISNVCSLKLYTTFKTTYSDFTTFHTHFK